MEPGTYIMNKRQIAKVQYLYNAKMRGREMAEAAELLRQKTPEEIAEIKGRTNMAAARRDEEWRLTRKNREKERV